MIEFNHLELLITNEVEVGGHSAIELKLSIEHVCVLKS